MQRGVSYIITAVVAVVLIFAWLLTAPLISWAVFLGDSYRRTFRPELK